VTDLKSGNLILEKVRTLQKQVAVYIFSAIHFSFGVFCICVQENANL